MESEFDMMDEDFFDPEDLEMMAAADTFDGVDITPSTDDLYEQIGHLGRLIFEGGEREKDLRLAANRLEALNEAAATGANLHTQIQQLADMIRVGAERETKLRESVARLSQMLGNREK